MKKIFLSGVLLASFTIAVFAQQNVGIGTPTPTNKLEVISEVPTALGASIGSTNNSTVGSAIYGVSNAAGTNAVYGKSDFGVGLYGYSLDNMAVSGAASGALGTAVSAISLFGKALEVFGKVRIDGDNANPSVGAVLTSDASGNAVWKPKKIGCAAYRAVNTSIPISTFRKVEFTNEDFDHTNNFVPYAGATTPATSVFTAPVAGIYHIAASVLFESTNGIESAQIRLIKNASGTVISNFENKFGLFSGSLYYVQLDTQGDFHLDANDKIWVEVAQRNIVGLAMGLNIADARGRFTTLLKMAD